MSKLLIAGGGTGGHVSAGLAIAAAWQQETLSTDILFVGSTTGLENQMVPKTGYPLKTLKVKGLNRVGWKRQSIACWYLIIACIQSIKILFEFSPHYILGVGGYASGPLILMACILKKLNLLKAQTAILEQNSVPGMTNRILSHFVDHIFIAFPESKTQFHHPSVIVTGNPIRFKIPSLQTNKIAPRSLFVCGGSQGAAGVNSRFLEALPDLLRWLQEKSLSMTLIHQTGEKDYQRVLQSYQTLVNTSPSPLHFKVEKFIDGIDQIYLTTQLVISRAGSSTLSELAAFQKAAILIPLPTAANHHQEHNAQVFTQAQAAYMFSETQSTGKELAQFIISLLEDPNTLQTLQTNIARFHHPNAAVNLIKAWII